MRNLKKALALVLALMMALSLMVTASASDYADDSAIEQDEAVSVMSALGVFNGMGDGTFAPDGTLTRAQAAKIITYMLLGQEVADSLPNTGSKFADCRDGQWYVGSVNYLTDLGIVAGRNETTFDPKGNVNGYEFAKMLLGALGYNSKTEQFEGSSAWTINVATTARRAGLDEGLAVSTISSIALTREQAAKLAFNTLTANMVYYQGGVVVDNVTVNPTRYTVSNASTNDYRVKAADRDSTMQFCEQYFPGLKFDTDFAATDDFGRALAKQWTVGDDVAYTGAAEATLVLTEDVDDGTGDALAKMLPKGTAIKAGGVTPTVNGAAAVGKVSTIAALAGLTGDGKQVEIYVKENATTKAPEVTDVIVTVYTVRTVSSITEKNGATTYKFSGNVSGVNKEDDTKVVLAGDIAKGDVVTTTTAKGKLYVYPTTKFTGSQTAKKGTTVTIGGAKYAIGTGVVGVDDTDFANSKTEGNYWADMNGFLVKVADIETEQEINYAIITNFIYGASTPSLDNPTTYTVNVRAVLDDGSVMDATLKLGKADTTNYITCGDVNFGATSLDQAKIQAQLGTGDKLFGYYIDDGKMVLQNVTGATTGMTKDEVYQQAIGTNPYKGETSLTNGGITAVFNSKTVFVIYNVDSSNNKVTAETHTGTAGLAINKTTGVADGVIVMGANSAAQGTAAVVFLKTTTVAPTVDYVYISVNNPVSELKADGSGSVWKYTGITPDGEEIDVVTSAGAAADKLTVNGLYEYDANKVVNSTAKVTVASATDATKQFVNVTHAQTNEELILVGSDWLSTSDDTKVVYLDELESIAGNNCLVEVKDGKVVTVFVYACRHTAKTWSVADAASEEDADVVYAAGDHIQTCGQCGKVLAAHAAAFPACADGTDHSETPATLTCTKCDLTKTCNENHPAAPADDE